MYFQPFYDESGKRHDHDGNATATQYSCSNGHKWTANNEPIKCWCGWPDKEKS